MLKVKSDGNCHRVGWGGGRMAVMYIPDLKRSFFSRTDGEVNWRPGVDLFIRFHIPNI